MDTLQAAKNDLRQGWLTPQGAICDCCHQTVKLYKRKMAGMAVRELIDLFKITDLNNPEFFHRSKFIKTVYYSCGDWAKLRHWGLISEKQNEDSSKKSSGEWRITEKGIDFVMGKIKVPSHIYIYNKETYNLVGAPESENIGVVEALGNKFNYPELMGYLI